MRQQCLIERASPADIVAVVDRLRGLHALLMSSVDLALWARIDGLEREAVVDALWRKRTLVKICGWRSGVDDSTGTRPHATRSSATSSCSPVRRSKGGNEASRAI